MFWAVIFMFSSFGFEFWQILWHRPFHVFKIRVLRHEKETGASQLLQRLLGLLLRTMRKILANSWSARFQERSQKQLRHAFRLQGLFSFSKVANFCWYLRLVSRVLFQTSTLSLIWSSLGRGESDALRGCFRQVRGSGPVEVKSILACSTAASVTLKKNKKTAKAYFAM